MPQHPEMRLSPLAVLPTLQVSQWDGWCKCSWKKKVLNIPRGLYWAASTSRGYDPTACHETSLSPCRAGASFTTWSSALTQQSCSAGIFRLTFWACFVLPWHSFCLHQFQVMQRSLVKPPREELQFGVCCRCCCVPFLFPLVLQQGSVLDPVRQWCLVQRESTSMLSGAAKSQVCEGRVASLSDEPELGGCWGTWWLGFHRACDELRVAAWKWVKPFWDTSALKLGGAGVVHMWTKERIGINPPPLLLSDCYRACICRKMENCDVI